MAYAQIGSSDLQVCNAGVISRSRPKKYRAFALALALFAAAFASARHPANIPSARVHVNEDRTVELHVRFDILAFCLEFTPQEIADAPMNALLDGPPSELTNRLADAKNRFLADTKVITDNGQATFQSITFPSLTDVQRCAQENGSQRLPVMLTAVLKEKLPVNAKTISCQFPSVMGSVVVTTELPYQEPVSEPIDPGAASTPLSLPKVAQVAPEVGLSTTTHPVDAKDPIATATALSNVPNNVETKTPSTGISRTPSKAAASSTSGSGAVGNIPGRRLEAKSSSKDNTTEQKGVKAAASITPRTAAVAIAGRLPEAENEAMGNRIGSNTEPETPQNHPSLPIVFARYVRMGFQHIIPQGLDHILFVLGLFLLSRKTKPLLTQISAFTIAHSITLGLSLYGVFSLPSKVVEPLIAASIVFVAVENIFTTEMKAWRPIVVFFFGLVHGLGFASALKETGLAHGSFLTGLVGFNAGVELGQLTVVAIAFAAVGWLRSKPSYRFAVVMPASIAIAFVAAFWTVQRLAL